MEMITRTNDEVTMQKILRFVKQIGLEISAKQPNSLEIKTDENTQSFKAPNIQWAKEPEKAKEFFGKWKDSPLNLSQIRNTAWGGRLSAL